ncbi:glycosyltransferase [Marinobacter sp. GN3S48]|uniref:glycosyltransferase n=1 Tax=Marinobacter sp. GN3S48 TaxID=3382302 RepID=UPI00387AB629
MATTPERVLHFIESGGLYGAEKVILNLSREMLRNGEFVPVVGCIVGCEEEQSDLFDAAVELGVEAVKLVIPNSRFPLALVRVSRQLKDMNVEIIHSHGYKPSVYGFVLRGLTGIPVIATCHLWFEMEKGPLKTRLMIALEKLFYRWFPQVVAVSDEIRRILLSNGVPGKKVSVVENGVAIEPLPDPEKPAQLKASLGFQPEEFCVFNAGRLTRQKAQWTLIDAAALLKHRGVKVQVLIAGEGGLKQTLTNRISELGVSDRVTLLGFRQDVAELLAMSDVVALPSLDEGMPMILLESTARGVPAVTTSVGDIPKLIRDGESGLIIPREDPTALADAIEKLQMDAGLRQRLASSAQAIMQSRYSSQTMHLQYHDIYKKLISGACS